MIHYKNIKVSAKVKAKHEVSDYLMLLFNKPSEHIEDLNQKIVELEYTNDRQATEIGDLQSDARHSSNELDELNSLVTSLEDILDNLEIS